MYIDTIFKELIFKNMDFINSEINKNVNSEIIKEITEILNKDKRIIVSGLDFGGKTEVIRTLIQKTKIADKVIYFNKKLDLDNVIKTNFNLEEYIKLSIQKNTKIIILQNIGFIKNIKDFLKEILKSNYKIIIIGNDIEINNVRQVEIKIDYFNNINFNLYYGNIGKVSILNNIHSQKEYISLIRDKIFLDNIFNLKSAKDINLYYSIITFLSKTNNYYSVRELHNNFSKIEDSAIKTFTDYLDYSEQSKIVKKIAIFDLVRKKEITKFKYFFTDNGILNSLNDFNQNKSILIKNIIFIKLNLYSLKIFGGRIGNYEFDFYIKGKNNNNFAIKISDESNYRKDLEKLKNLKSTKKIIIIKNLEKTNIEKEDFLDFEFVDLGIFFEKFDNIIF